ncbi:RICIN domain-containing protein [Streptomyces sp. BE20]|uniref:RICIN domain-containing protein n=1 Tax=Streptomyces sp. BE20 TaxID=3002525 RepID=UPI002E796A12|nr:RICIN domain-containing protein [Streptomyces sp. BE20]MEE1825218.1 RICIN domain-containing protein [Streptomyces sp. BE20]
MRRSWLLPTAVILGLLVPGIPTATSVATAGPVSTGLVANPGPYYTFAARHSSQCVNVRSASTANATAVIQWPCIGGAPNEQWRLQETDSGYVRVIARHSSQCLNVRGGSTSDGAAVIQWPCTDGARNEQWKPEDLGNGHVRLVARQSGKCLNVANSSPTWGTGLVQSPCDSTESEQLTQTPVTTQVVTWAASTDRLGNAVQDRTHRLIVHTSTGGSGLRIRLSNAFGQQPVTFGAGRVGLRSSGAAVTPGRNSPLTFNGASSVTVPAGGTVYSDPLDTTVQAGSDLAVSLYVQQASGTASGHKAARQTSYVAPQGDHAADDAGTSFTQTVTTWSYLDAVVVDAPTGTGAVATLGDSITDGLNSTQNTNRRWPDVLAARLQNTPGNLVKGVANEGISGNEVLKDHNNFGESAVRRLDRDVLSQRGLRTVVLLEGINDIIRSAPTAQALTDGYRDIVDRAHAAGVCVMGATIMPYQGSAYWTAAGEQVRQQVNEVIRSGALFDAVVDFDAVMRDPAQPSRLLPSYDGDHLHPNDAGMRAMGEAVSVDNLRCTR